MVECFEHFDAALASLQSFDRFAICALYGSYLLQSGFILRANSVLLGAWQSLEAMNTPNTNRHAYFYSLFKVGFVLGKSFIAENSNEKAYQHLTKLS